MSFETGYQRHSVLFPGSVRLLKDDIIVHVHRSVDSDRVFRPRLDVNSLKLDGNCCFKVVINDSFLHYCHIQVLLRTSQVNNNPSLNR